MDKKQQSKDLDNKKQNELTEAEKKAFIFIDNYYDNLVRELKQGFKRVA